MKLVNNISSWPALRWPWFLLAGSALVLETIALYFQYAMHLEPCVMCIYQRTAVFGLIVAGLIPLANPKNIVLRFSGFALWLTSAFWGLKIAFEHAQMQNPDNFLLAMSCDVYPNFPSWFAIHQWFPAIFEARGTCDTIDWQFLGLSMPEWMVVSFAIYSVLAVATLFTRLIKHRNI